jgi:hypothetical protein
MDGSYGDFTQDAWYPGVIAGRSTPPEENNCRIMVVSGGVGNGRRII